MSCSLVVMVAFSATGFGADPVLGTWKLNVEKSNYTPGPAPKRQTRTYEAHPMGIRVTIQTVHADGQTVSVQHPVNYDGKEHPITGDANQAANAIVLVQIDPFTSEATLKHANKIIGTNRRIVAADGRSMTITYQGTDARGRPVKNTAVYDKQKE